MGVASYAPAAMQHVDKLQRNFATQVAQAYHIQDHVRLVENISMSLMLGRIIPSLNEMLRSLILSLEQRIQDLETMLGSLRNEMNADQGKLVSCERGLHATKVHHGGPARNRQHQLDQCRTLLQQLQSVKRREIAQQRAEVEFT